MNHTHKSHPTVSVIIPCYRQGHLLAQAIQSVLDQSYPHVKPIVVNDGSDDATAEVAFRFGNRITYIEQPNSGLSSARNTGIKASQSTHLLFLDADDMLHPQATEWLLHAIEYRDDCVAIMGYRTFTSPGKWIDYEYPPNAQSFFPWLIHRNYPVHCFLTPHRLIASTGLFNTHLAACEDHDYWLRLALLHDRIKTTPQLGAYYRKHPASMSSNIERMLGAWITIINTFARSCTHHNNICSRFGTSVLSQLHLARMLALKHTSLASQRTESEHLINLLHNKCFRTNLSPYHAAYKYTPQSYWPLLDNLTLQLIRWLRPSTYNLIVDMKR